MNKQQRKNKKLKQKPDSRKLKDASSPSSAESVATSEKPVTPRNRDISALQRPAPRRTFLWFIFIGSIFGSMAVMTYFRIPPSRAPIYTYQVLKVHQHDQKAFTQGLLLDNGRLYESTGRLGQSTLRLIEIGSEQPLVKKSLPDNYFGEGIAIYGSKLYQLTYQNNIIRIYDKDSLELLEERDFPFDGWGLTADSDYLIHSDGTSTIRFLDPESFDVVSKITVHDGKQKIPEINELEYFDGRIYANVWHEDFILQIVPATGRVSARFDMSGLLDPPLDDEEACLNGIAVDKETNTFYVTGKLWPKLFEVKFVKQKDD